MKSDISPFITILIRHGKHFYLEGKPRLVSMDSFDLCVPGSHKTVSIYHRSSPWVLTKHSVTEHVGVVWLHLSCATSTDNQMKRAVLTFLLAIMVLLPVIFITEQEGIDFVFVRLESHQIFLRSQNSKLL